MQDLESWLLSNSCPLTDVLKWVCARGPQKALTCLCECVWKRERGRQRDWKGKRERKNLSECVLLRHHTLRPKESMPGAVWEDFILHIEEAIQVMGCVCLRVYVCQVVLVSLRMHTSVPGLLFSQTQVVHFNFVNLTNILSLICTDSVKGTKIDRKDKLSV